MRSSCSSRSACRCRDTPSEAARCATRSSKRDETERSCCTRAGSSTKGRGWGGAREGREEREGRARTKRVERSEAFKEVTEQTEEQVVRPDVKGGGGTFQSSQIEQVLCQG